MGNLRQNLLLGTLTLVLMAWFWMPSLDNPLDPGQPAIDAATVSTYVTDSRRRAYDETGQLAEILEATRVEHRDDTDVAELDQPRYYAHHGDNRSWSLRAQQGTLQHDSGVLLLRRDVLLKNDQSGGTLSASAMRLNLRSRLAVSWVPVTIRWNGNNITADGMQADLVAETIQLEPNVESLYVPTRQ